MPNVGTLNVLYDLGLNDATALTAKADFPRPAAEVWMRRDSIP